MKKSIYLLIISVAFLLIESSFTQQREDYDIRNAEKSFFEGKHDKVFKTLERVLYNGKPTVQQIEKIHLLFALSYIENNQLYLAEEEIDEIFKINPTFKFDVDTYGSKYFSLFEEVKNEIIGAVKVTTVPDSADIYIDGEHKGISPLIVDPIYASQHKFTAVKEKYELVSQDQRVFPAETTNVKIQLPRSEIVGIIKIHSDPNSAEIYIDNEYRGQTPLVVGNLIPGRYKITIAKKGYLVKEGLYVLDPRKTEEVMIELEKNKDHFVFSEIFPGLGQFSKGYIKHGILFSAGTISYIYYYSKVRFDPYLNDPANRLRTTWDGYFIGNREVTKDVYHVESRLQSLKEKNHQKRLTRAYLIGGAYYLINLIDTVVVIRLDIRRKLREEQERFALKLNSDLDKITLNLSIKF